VIIVGALISVIVGLQYSDPAITWALVLAPLIIVVNSYSGVLLAWKGFKASQSTFFKMVFGGMGVRLLLLGAIIALIYKFGHLNFVVFLLALMIYYFVLLIIEVLFINGKFHTNSDT